MKQFLKINIDSVINLITNSSSELFVSKKQLSKDAVMEIIAELFSNKQPNIKPEDVLDVDIITKENVFKVIEEYGSWFMSKNSMPSIWECIEKLGGYIYPYDKFEDYNNIVAEKAEAMQKVMMGKYMTQDFSHLYGNVIIFSLDDNSIPYELFDDIEQLFNARRYHMG